MRELTGGEAAAAQLWNPASVSVVGASSREGSLSWWPQRLLQQYGFAGEIVPVNPHRDEIGGLSCAASIGAIGHPVDAAVIVLDAVRTLAAVHECAAAGVGSVVLPSQGFGESGEAGRAIEREILAAARAHGVRVHGPNCDGLANFASGAVLSIQPILGDGVEVGRVAVVTQSGATAGSLISRLRDEGIGVKYYASVGNEIDLGLADYVSVALQDPEIDLVLTFIEAVRQPEQFTAVARLAAELGKPIVAIKVGRTKQAAARAAAHTGALAGEDRIYQALFDSVAIIRVDELSEIVAVAKLHLAAAARGHAIGGRDLAIMSVSGGQAGALADRAAGFGLRLPELAAPTQARLTELFPHGNALNPCDLTGDVARKAELAAQAYAAFDEDGGVDVLVYARKELTSEMGRRSAVELAVESSRRALPLAVYSMDGHVNADERATYAAHGVPLFSTAGELFVAIRGLADFANRRVVEPAPTGTPVATVPDGRVGALPEEEARALLAAYGIAFPSEALVTDVEQAVKVADEVGHPVAMKVVSDRILHKTEIGGVVLGVAGPDEVRAAYAVLTDRARAALAGDEPDGILVQQQVVDGVEIIVGTVVDPDFGPFVLVGTGGVMAELLDDTVLRPAPVTPQAALEMVRSLRGHALLDGFRGAAPADVAALADTVSRLSRLAADHASVLRELDLNPVLVRPGGHGAVAVDALVVLRTTGGEQGR